MSQRLLEINQQIVCQNNLIDYEKVRQDVKLILKQDGHDEYGHIGPILVRLAWHSAGTYSKFDQSGGSNGATMRFQKELSDPENNGLQVAQKYLEQIKQKHPAISYSDLWILASYVALEDMGLPRIEFIPGRKDAQDDAKCPPQGRLPDPSKDRVNMRQVFYRMGFNDQEIVALVGGGHTLGKCHKEYTGYEGPWTEEPIKFSNLFFQELFNEEWIEKKWDGKKQFVDKEDKQMMLPTDLELRDDPEFRKYSLIYKEDNDRLCSDFSKAYKKLTELGFRQF
ncbi:hypothetical protein ABPG74_001054 [Tetrahymena malaccensis]